MNDQSGKINYKSAKFLPDYSTLEYALKNACLFIKMTGNQKMALETLKLGVVDSGLTLEEAKKTYDIIVINSAPDEKALMRSVVDLLN